MENQYLDHIILNQGNQQPLMRVMKMAQEGKNVTIGYLGGSITRGSVASTPEKCYAYRSFLWWEEQFPTSHPTYVNAGIGATTSQFAVARVEEDLLYAKPDVVFVEFSVNDENDDHFCETYEGLIRKLLSTEKCPAVVLLHNSFLDSGRSAVEIHSKVGRHYDLPSVSIKANLYDRIAAGELDATTITSDYLHPNDLGHEMVADTVKEFLNRVYAKLVNIPEGSQAFTEDNGNAVNGERGACVGTECITKNRYEQSKRLQNGNYIFAGNVGFEKDGTLQTDMTDVFKNGWEARHTGDVVECELDCTTIAVQFRRSIRKPAPMAKVTIDGCEEKAIYLDGEFDETWGDLIALQTVWEGECRQKHHFRLEIVKHSPEDKSGFYLVSVLTS